MTKQFILIMADTVRKDMLGCYGNPNMHTPNIDRLCAQGIRYDNAYSCQPGLRPRPQCNLYRRVPSFQRRCSKLFATG